MPKVKDARHYYDRHRESARQRGILFLFAFDEWILWWFTHLGPKWLKKRGPKSGQYVMARKGDKGPYAPWNVECITSNQNHKDTATYGTSTHGVKNPNAKLTESQVREIYLSKPIQEAALKSKYKISFKYIKRIKERAIWSRVTKDLPSPQFKGYSTGVNHPRSKLTIELVREIYFSKEPTTIISKRLGVPKGNVKGIRNRREWKSVTSEWPDAPARSRGKGIRMDLLFKNGQL